MNIIKTYKPCEQCLGSGIETNGRIFREEGYQSVECAKDHGEILLTIRKEISNEQPNPNDSEPESILLLYKVKSLLEDYSEEQAEEQLHDRLKELILEGKWND